MAQLGAIIALVWFSFLANNSQVMHSHYRTLNLNVEGSQHKILARERLSLPPPAPGQHWYFQPGLQTVDVWHTGGPAQGGGSLNHWEPEKLSLLLIALSSGLNKVFVKRNFAGRANANEYVASHVSPQMLLFVGDRESGQWFVFVLGAGGGRAVEASGVRHSSGAPEGPAEPGVLISPGPYYPS